MRRLLVVAFVACSAPASGPVARGPSSSSPSSGAPAAADPAPPAFRLPGDVRPVRYALDLTIVPDAPRATGKVHVDARVVRPTRAVWMHAVGLEITKATLGGAPVRVISHDDMIGLVSERELLTGDLAIDLAFTAPIDPTKSRGLYAEREGNDVYAYTFFEATDARRAFPCFDEPSYKVPWKLTFHVKADHVALGNAPVVKQVEEPDDMKRVELAETRPLPSYLVAFVVGPFEVVDGGVAGRVKTPIRFIIPKGRAGELGWAKQVTPRVVAALERYFDMDYPYGKLDVAVVPRFWGTMEHPGIVAMGQPLTLIRPDEETRSRKQGYANILGHELAHYWFGDYVTMVWWDDTWLNEALGEWMDMIITEAVEPAWHYRDARVHLANSAMNADETLSASPIRRSVTTAQDIQASFDNDITYAKGATVFRMFEAWVGDAKWQAFIRDYLRAHAWGNASASDFLGKAKAHLGPDVEAGLRSFLEQPGVPRIAIEPVCEAGKLAKLRVHQQRALPATVKDPEPKTWRVPVCARFGTQTASAQACVQLDGADGELPVEGVQACPTWILPNANANGYYRSAVDIATAKQLLTPASAIAKQAKPTVAERMMLVDDLAAAVERGELGIEQLLALVPLVVGDPDERVAMMAFRASTMPTTALDDDTWKRAKRFAQKSFGPTARRLGWQRAKADSDERHELRRALVPAVAYEDPVLGKQAEQLADTWLGKRSGVAPDLVQPVLAAAAYRGNAARFDRMLAAAKQPRDRREQQEILRNLGGFRDPALVARALDLVLGSDFDLRDKLGIVYGVLFKRETRDLAMTFLQQHLDELLARMRADEASWFLGAIAGSPCDPARRAAVAELVTKRAEQVEGAQVAVARGLEQSQVCIDTAALQMPALKKFLAKY
ncbi:MAG TPA: M1 family metallopeptidase [Kofleriaceae bacterium]|nr:M1 family metallopeptidase [Kofleriaceae bacterium]